MSEEVFYIKYDQQGGKLRFAPKNINGTAFVLKGLNCNVSFGQDQYSTNSANYLNCASWGDDIPITTVGTNGKGSYYGTFDQGGNVWEWTDGAFFGGPGQARKILRGGGHGTIDNRYLRRGYRSGPMSSTGESKDLLEDRDTLITAGFRVATINNSRNYSGFVTVGNPGNVVDATNYGKVDYVYQISKYPVTNTQYAEFLNSVTYDSDPFGLFYADGNSDPIYGITRSGSSGNYTYAVKTNMENKPVVRISWFTAARYCNWLHNGKPSGIIESAGPFDYNQGAYNLIDPDTFEETYNVTNFSTLNDSDVALLNKVGTSEFINRRGQFVQLGPRYYIPTEDEWYKAAYYDPTIYSRRSTNISISNFKSTGSNVIPGNTAQDANWSVVALPSSYNGDAVPYSGEILDTVPSVWLGQSSHIVGDEIAEGFRNALWISPSLTYDSLLNNNYNVIFSGNFTASDTGDAYLSFAAWGDDEVQCYLGGTIINTNTDTPSISGGIKISNPGNRGGIFEGIYPVTSGINTIYAVVPDSPGGAVGLLVSTDPVNYWRYATRSENDPCCISALPNGDGVGSDYGCVSGTTNTVTISNANPAVITLNNHGLNNNDPVYFTTTGSLPSGLMPYVKYYVKNSSTNTFEVTAKLGCASVATTTNGSGTHTMLYNTSPIYCDIGDPILTDFSLTSVTCAEGGSLSGINIGWNVTDINGYNFNYEDPGSTYSLCNYNYMVPSSSLQNTNDFVFDDSSPKMIIQAIIRQSGECFCGPDGQEIPIVPDGGCGPDVNIGEAITTLGENGYSWVRWILSVKDGFSVTPNCDCSVPGLANSTITFEGKTFVIGPDEPTTPPFQEGDQGNFDPPYERWSIDLLAPNYSNTYFTYSKTASVGNTLLTTFKSLYIYCTVEGWKIDIAILKQLFNSSNTIFQSVYQRWTGVVNCTNGQPVGGAQNLVLETSSIFPEDLDPTFTDDFTVPSFTLNPNLAENSILVGFNGYCCGSINSTQTFELCGKQVPKCDTSLPSGCSEFFPNRGGTNISVVDIAAAPISINVEWNSNQIAGSGRYVVTADPCDGQEMTLLSEPLGLIATKLTVSSLPQWYPNSYIDLSFYILLPNGQSSNTIRAGSVYVDSAGQLSITSSGVIT